MVSPNKQLEAAFLSLSSAPGLTDSDVSRIRAALVADPHVLKEFNARAASGDLGSFDIEDPMSVRLPVGHYDIDHKTVTLPRSLLNEESTSDAVAVGRVQAMVMSFAKSTYSDGERKQPLTKDMVDNFQSVLNESPELAREIKRVATTPDPVKPSQMLLQRFRPLGPELKVGGAYSIDDHEIQIPARYLVTKTPGATEFFSANDMTFVLGHEVRHAFNNYRVEEEKERFRAEARSVAATAGPAHDYTAAIASYVQIARDDEAEAELAGWNALLSKRQQLEPNMTLEDMYFNIGTGRTRDFLEIENGKVVPRPGVSINDDLSLDHTPENVRAMGVHYFDRASKAYPDGHPRPVGLGYSGVADYKNYYGAQAVSEVLSIDARSRSYHGEKPQLTVDMKKLGLHEDLLEREGINTGLMHSRREYYDSSLDPTTPKHFDHTTSGAHRYSYVPAAPDAHSPRICDVDHPDRALYDQARALVHRLDRDHGRAPDERSDRLASALVVSARADGLSRIDTIHLSPDASKVWAVETKPGDRDHFFDKRTSIPTMEALDTSQETSAQRWPQAMEQYNVCQQSEALSREQAQIQQQSQSHGMSMSR